MKSDRVSWTSNRIPSTDEIMPDLNHCGIYNTQNSEQTLCMRIYIHVVPDCQIANKANKARNKCKHQSQEKNTQATDVHGSRLGGKRHQSLAKPDKIKFLNEPKQTKLAKQKHGVSTMHTNICVTFDMSFATPQSNSSAPKNYSLEQSI